jgi:hypothetical protein
MSATNSVVAVYDSHEQAERAVKALQRAGIDMKSLSIAGRGTHTDEHVVGYYNAGDRMKYWGKLGAFWGGFWGLLFGSAIFAIPGIGPVLVAGPLVGWIVSGLEGAAVVGGVSALGAGLVSIGIPKDSVIKYDRPWCAGRGVWRAIHSRWFQHRQLLCSWPADADQLTLFCATGWAVTLAQSHSAVLRNRSPLCTHFRQPDPL